MAIKDRGSLDASMKGGGLTVEDVFSTYVYTGNGASQDIVNGIDLVTNGGMVWSKSRNGAVTGTVIDTERGGGLRLVPSGNDREYSTAGMISSFNTDGYSIGDFIAMNSALVGYEDLVSWTFRKASKFFDIVTWTGDGTVGRTIPHDLGIAPGMIITKVTSKVNPWFTYHKSTGATKYLELNTAAVPVTNNILCNDTAPTDTVFTVGGTASVNPTNELNETFVAYLFAHDPDGVISCGELTADGSGHIPFENLGWEPQYILLKNITSAWDWEIHDVTRGWHANTTYENFVAKRLSPNTSLAETVGVTGLSITANGFYSNANFGTGEKYIYMAIRRPMSNECGA